MIQIRISYSSEEDAGKVLRFIEDSFKNVKVKYSNRGKYKKIYIVADSKK